jgi:hypothetical protein
MFLYQYRQTVITKTHNPVLSFHHIYFYFNIIIPVYIPWWRKTVYLYTKLDYFSNSL